MSLCFSFWLHGKKNLKEKKQKGNPFLVFREFKKKKKKGKRLLSFWFSWLHEKKNLKEKIQKERNHIRPCGFPFDTRSILGLVVFLLDKRRRTTVDKEHQTNNLVCWKVLCKLNKKNTKEGFELKTLSSRAKAHPNKPHALL